MGLDLLQLEILVTAHLHKKRLQKKLSDLNRETRKLKSRLKVIEQRRAELMKEIEG
jgi:hypothetical protein